MIDVCVLAAFDAEVILASVNRTSRAVIVHEATRTAGFGAEIAARIADEALLALDAPVRRIAYPDEPVPFNKGLESANLPDPAAIAATLRELVAW